MKLIFEHNVEDIFPKGQKQWLDVLFYSSAKELVMKPLYRHLDHLKLDQPQLVKGEIITHQMNFGKGLVYYIEVEGLYIEVLRAISKHFVNQLKISVLSPYVPGDLEKTRPTDEPEPGSFFTGRIKATGDLNKMNSWTYKPPIRKGK